MFAVGRVSNPAGKIYARSSSGSWALSTNTNKPLAAISGVLQNAWAVGGAGETDQLTGGNWLASQKGTVDLTGRSCR